MKNLEHGGPAFPLHEAMSMEPGNVDEHKRLMAGMSLRDYFAAKCDIDVYAPVDSLYRELGRNPTVNEMADWIADVRFIEADAMLKRRAK